MVGFESALDCIKEVAGLAKKREKRANLITIILAIVLCTAVIASVVYAVIRYLKPSRELELDDYDDDFLDDTDDFFEDEEDEEITIKPQPVVEETEELLGE